jgi:Flp pilus assembly protein TadB
MATIYQVNKGINKPIEFKGLKAQYIAYLAAGLVTLLLAFTIMYLIGIHIYICLFVIAMAGGALYSWVTRSSRKYGRYGLMKKAGRKQIPEAIKFSSRKIFTGLNRTR